MARGVDAATHRGALAGPGPTVAVLGSGVDVVYPREHGELMNAIARRGAVMSEWGPGVPPLAYHFPLRNRLISGLAAAVVVVEATARSGSLITARYAADQGREVMAVSGNVLSGRNRGAHALIRDGAKIVETADDILRRNSRVGRKSRVGGKGRARRTGRAGAGRPENDPVLRHMGPGEVYNVDTISERSGLDSGALLAKLTDLEVDGRVQRLGPGRFVRGSRVVVT